MEEGEDSEAEGGKEAPKDDAKSDGSESLGEEDEEEADNDEDEEMQDGTKEEAVNTNGDKAENMEEAKEVSNAATEVSSIHNQNGGVIVVD